MQLLSNHRPNDLQAVKEKHNLDCPEAGPTYLHSNHEPLWGSYQKGWSGATLELTKCLYLAHLLQHVRQKLSAQTSSKG